jgi:hypothetical protein
MGWDAFQNGTLLRMSEEGDFEALITGDQNLFYQQNNAKRRISLVVLTNIELKSVTPCFKDIRLALERAVPGSYEVVTIERMRSKPWGRPSKL